MLRFEGPYKLFAEKIMRQFQVLRSASIFTGCLPALMDFDVWPVQRSTTLPVAKVQRRCPGSQSGIKTATRRVSQLDSLAMILCGARSCNMNRNAFSFSAGGNICCGLDCEFNTRSQKHFENTP